MKKKLIENSIFSVLIHISNYVIPLLIIPYLTRVYGSDGFGKIAFTQSFVALASIFIEYGFSLSSTRELSKNLNDIQKINDITVLTIGSKLILYVLTGILIYPLKFILPIFGQDIGLFLVSYLILLSLSLNIDWFFLGLQTLRIYAFLNFIGKIILLLLVFIFLKSGSEPYFYLLILGSIQLISNLIGILLINKIYQISFFLPKLKTLIIYIKNSFNLFFFKLTVSLYTSANSFIVGLITDTNLTGLYAGAEKITRAFAGIWAPLNNVLFAKMSELTGKNINYAKKIFKIVLIIYFFLGLTLSFILFFEAEKIVSLILGSKFTDSVKLIKIQSFVVFLIAGSNSLGLLWLIPLKKDKEFNIIISIAGLVNILLGTILTFLYNIYGMAVSVLLVEFFVTIACFFTIQTKKEIKIV